MDGKEGHRDTECPLSHTTSRLSISGNDALEAKTLLTSLSATETSERRDSAVSFESMNDEVDGNKSSLEAGDNADGGQTMKGKRRRSSAIQFMPPKPNNVGGRKKKRGAKEPVIGFDDENDTRNNTRNGDGNDDENDDSKHSISHNSVSMLAFRSIFTSIFSDLPSEENSLNITGSDNIQKVVICFVGGLTRNDFVEDTNYPSMNVPIKQAAKQKFPFIYNHFSGGLLTKSPGDKKNVFPPLEAIINMRLTKKERRNLLNDLKNTKITINDLLMPLPAMLDQNYPIHSNMIKSEVPSGWVETKSFDHDGSHIFSLDCEFSQTQYGKELTRISIVNFPGEIVYDTYVKPSSPITDYLTKYSGITEELLEGVETTLQDVQNKFVEIISSDDVLIGHSLESDLNILHIRHPKIVDTSCCYEHVRGHPYKPGLKWLTKRYLNRDIQLGETSGQGHSSVEDARACLDLVKLKIKEGLLFGINDMTTSVFDRLNESRARLGKDVINSIIVDYKYLSNKRKTTKSFNVINDDEVVDIYSKEINDADIAILNLRELEASLGWNSPCEVRGADAEEAYDKLDNRLLVIYSSLPKNCVFIVSGIYGANTNDHLSLKRVKNEFEAKKKRGENLDDLSPEEMWDLEKTSALDDAMTKARDCISFVTIKS